MYLYFAEMVLGVNPSYNAYARIAPAKCFKKKKLARERAQRLIGPVRD